MSKETPVFDAILPWEEWYKTNLDLDLIPAIPLDRNDSRYQLLEQFYLIRTNAPRVETRDKGIVRVVDEKALSDWEARADQCTNFFKDFDLTIRRIRELTS